MMNKNDQFIDSPGGSSGQEELANISKLGVDLVVARNDIIKLKNQLEMREKTFKQLSEVLIPEAMQKVNMTSFGLTNGFKLEVKPVVLVTLPKDNADLADEWLDENGHSGMMKHHIDIHLPKGIDTERVHELKATIKKLGFESSDNKTIHYQTLAKWGREMTEEGEEIPEDIFKVYRGYTTNIKG